MPKVAIVADDLTGAFDAAAPFAARGLATRVAIAPAALARLGGPCDVIALSTASRHLAPGEAATAVAAACRALAPLAPVGMWLGVWCHKRVPEVWFFRVCYVLLFAAGAKQLYDGLSAQF